MRSKRKILISSLCFLIIYLFGLTLGLVSIFNIPKYRHKEDFLYEAGKIVEQYKSGEQIEIWLVNKLCAVYSDDGELLDLYGSKNHPLTFDTDMYLAPLIPSVLKCSTGYYHTIIMYNGITSQQSVNGTAALGGNIDFVTLVAVPFEYDGRGCVLFFASDNASQSTYLIVYAIVFSGIAVILLFAYIGVERERQKYYQLKKNYIDNVAHSLKTPVASVKALVLDMVDHDMDQQTQSEYFGIMLSELNRQESMITNILKLSKLQSGKFPIKKKECCVAEILDPLINSIRPIYEDLDIEFNTPEITTLDYTVKTDPNYIKQILQVLLENAPKYLDAEGIVNLTVVKRKKYVEICVSDNGSGIPKEKIPYIFERFYSGENNSSGLGLAIAKETADLLGEKLWVISEEGKETAFYLTIHS